MKQEVVVAAVPRTLTQQAHRRLIGYLGFCLPGLLYLVGGLRPTDALPPWRLLTSISGYYYTGAVGIFIGILFALALFLLTYPGYEGEWADRVLGWIGGAAALGVALFPTTAPDGLLPPSWWTPALRTIHYGSAVTLFCVFILFSVWLFRKSNEPVKERRQPGKRRRDRTCLICGLAMIVCVLWAASALVTHGPIFWPEALAVMAFAISWLVKGEAYQPIVVRVRRIWSRYRT